MKCTVVFLVLSMVVLMAEPGEGFIGLLISGAISGTVRSFCLQLGHTGETLIQLIKMVSQSNCLSNAAATVSLLLCRTIEHLFFTL